MLNRTKIRRYLTALLCSEEIPQSAACKVGKLWETCDVAADISDSTTRQLIANIEASQDVKVNCVHVNIRVPTVDYELCVNKIQNSTITFYVDIVVEDSTGYKRENTLDAIEERILYRLFSNAQIEDAQTGDMLKSFMGMAKPNTPLRMKTTGDSDYDGNGYAIRELEFTIETNECITQPKCNVKALCFDFKNLTKLSKGS